MKLLELTHIKEFTTRNGNTVKLMHGLYQCPICNDTVEIPKKYGPAKKSCAKQSCKGAVVKITQDAKVRSPSKYMKLITELGIQERITSTGTKKRETMAVFICGECDEPVTIVRSDGIKAKSCGVCATQVRSQTKILSGNKYIVNTHGMSATKFYTVWSSMVQRCHNETAQSYHKYGAKGVIVCDRWRTFENFRDDMLESYNQLKIDIAENKDMLYAPDDRPSLDRIKSKGNYELDNCEWITLVVNSKKDGMKPVVRLDKVTGEELEHYKSVRAAEISMRAKGYRAIDHAISYVCSGKRNSHLGFKWKYKDNISPATL